MQSGERAGKTADGVGDDPISERAIALDVLIGVDDDIADLRCEALEHVSATGLVDYVLPAERMAARTAWFHSRTASADIRKRLGKGASDRSR